MEVIHNGVVRMLIPDKGYKLANKETGITSSKVYLGLADSPDNYTEVVDDKYIPIDYVVDLAELKESTNEVIDVILASIDEIYKVFEPLLGFMPMMLSEELEEVVVSPLVKLYIMMIERGLKTLDDVPEKFKDDVIKLMNK